MQPRHDPEAEKAIIGAVLVDERVMDEFVISPEDFYLPAHEQLWALISSEKRAGRPVQALTLTQKLVAHPISGVGTEYLYQCMEDVTTASVAPHYADIIKGLANLRRISEVGTKLINASQSADWEGSEQTLDNARADLDKAANAATGIKVRTFSDALREAVDVWENPRPRGMSTGWPEVDELFNGGWRPGNLTVIGARPAVGKSLVAGCAAIASAESGVGFFSLEMLEEEVIARMTAAAQDIKLSKINNSRLDDDDWQKIVRLAKRSADWPVYIETNSQISMAQIRATLRTWQRRGPVPLVIIDYLQLVRPADRGESRERQVARVAEDCKHLAKEFNTHVIALAQVNRNSAQGEQREPRPSDLRESGGIEAFADNIILLHRERDDDENIKFIVGKNRHGRTGDINLVFRPHIAAVSSPAQNFPNHESRIA